MSKLSAEQTAELKKAFEVMDANKDGVVTKDELKTLLKGLGEEVTDEVVDEMIKIADENGDGKIQFEEFCKAATAEWTPAETAQSHQRPYLWVDIYINSTKQLTVGSQTTNWNALSTYLIFTY